MTIRDAFGADSLRWDEVFVRFDMPSYFSAGIKGAIATSVRVHDRPVRVGEWRLIAQDFNRAGFTPWDYYLLRLCLRLPDGEPRRGLTGFDRFNRSPLRFDYFHEPTKNAADPRLRADAWRPWLRDVRAGEMPHSALACELHRLMQREFDRFGAYQPMQ